MRREELSDLAAFMVVADEKSFTRAAAKLATSQSALSHAMRRLEERLGLRLLTRTTRSVAPTEAGERLLEALVPALGSIEARIADLSGSEKNPSGTIRIVTPGHAAASALRPAIARLLPEHPGIRVEITSNSAAGEAPDQRIDAEVRSGPDRVFSPDAIPIGPKLRMAVVGSTAYFERRGVPKVPDDLTHHSCVGLRLGNGDMQEWSFRKDGREVRMQVKGQIVVDDPDLIVVMAETGLGLGFVMEDQVAVQTRVGTLVRVLDDWCEPFPGYHLCRADAGRPSLALDLLAGALRHEA